MTLGSLIITVLMDFFGRRWVHAGTTFLVGIAWLLIYCASDFTTLLIGRLIGGLGIGSGYACGCCVVSECVAPEYRGVFLNIKTVTLFIGYLYMHVMAHYYHWRIVALLGVIPCVLTLLNNFTWPESPSWLLSKNRFEECEKNFFWLRGSGEKAVRELEAMIRAQKARMSQRPSKISSSQKVLALVRKFKQASFLKPMLITLFCAILLETSGRHFFPAYALDIVMEIADKSDSFLLIIAIDIVSCVSTLVSCILVSIWGRKSLLMFSGVTSTILLLVISLLTYWTSQGSLVLRPWIVPLLVCSFFVLTNLGCTAVPLIIYAEIFPLPHREVGIGLGGVLLSLVFFVYVKLVPYSMFYLKIHGTFLAFALGMIVSLVYLYCALPETRNRTLQEIEDYFEHGKFLDDEEASLRVQDEREKMLELRLHQDK